MSTSVIAWQPLVAGSNPTASKAATQYCGLGCRSLSSSGLKAGANTPLNSYGASGGADLGFAAWKDVDMPDGNH